MGISLGQVCDRARKNNWGSEGKIMPKIHTRIVVRTTGDGLNERYERHML